MTVDRSHAVPHIVTAASISVALDVEEGGYRLPNSRLPIATFHNCQKILVDSMTAQAILI
jgi:hypothetical protein